MSQQPEAIDRDKLRAAVRKLAHEYVFFMLDDAIARKAATPEQRKALAGAPDRQASRRRGGTKS